MRRSEAIRTSVCLTRILYFSHQAKHLAILQRQGLRLYCGARPGWFGIA